MAEQTPPKHEDTLGAVHGAPEDVAKKYAETGATGTGAASDDLDSLHVPELKEKARELNIDGASAMNRDELIKAIKKAQK